MSGRHDAYGGLARHYDLHGWDWYAGASGERLLALLSERGLAAGGSVLDAGCGTGSMALMLARAGYRVTGVDLSADMIARAKEKDPSASVVWRVGDITALDAGASFDAIVSVADVFNHLPSLDDWEAALTGFRRHLRPGGLAFVDAMTCRGLERMDVQSVEQRGGLTLILAIVYEPAARRSTLKVTSFAPSAADPALFERGQQTITEWGHPFAEVVARFARAGFPSVERIWATSGDPEADDRMTLLAPLSRTI
jgi:2-polyprenyl-3-methyl-5-hydroxy-6-metoxy-1,4-benzoquinol methylase